MPARLNHKAKRRSRVGFAFQIYKSVQLSQQIQVVLRFMRLGLEQMPQHQ
jgi:hypothetical protein